MPLAIAALQLDYVASEPMPSRVDRVLAALTDAPDADLLVLPELWDVGYFAFDNYDAVAAPLDAGPLVRVAEVARVRGVTIVAGSVLERSEAGLHNTVAVIGANGCLDGAYRKVHLFSYGSREGELLTAGDGHAVVHVGGVHIGIATCFDLRFADQFAAMRDDGADLFVVPASWPAARAQHWEVLVQARAIENQTPIVAVNGVGPCEGVQLAGRSMVVDARGVVLTRGDESTGGWLEATVDPDDTRAWREEFPLRQATHA